MKDLKGNELKRGDALVAVNSDGVAIVGNIHEFYDSQNEFRMSGWPLRVKADSCLLAQNFANEIKAAIDKRVREAANETLKVSQPEPVMTKAEPLVPPNVQTMDSPAPVSNYAPTTPYTPPTEPVG